MGQAKGGTHRLVSRDKVIKRSTNSLSKGNKQEVALTLWQAQVK